MPTWDSSCSYCLTGTLVFTRPLVQQLIGKLGASTHANVTSSTVYLVCGQRPGGTKTRAARQWGISCLDELAFWHAVPLKHRPPLVEAWLAGRISWDEARNAAADIKTFADVYDRRRLPWKARHNLSAVVDEPDVLPPGEAVVAKPPKTTVTVKDVMFGRPVPNESKRRPEPEPEDDEPDRLFDL